MNEGIFSRRTDWPAHSNRLWDLADRYRREETPLLDLTVSNPLHCGLGPDPDAPDWLSGLADPVNLRYTPDPKGLISAREAVAAYYAAKGVSVRPEQIVLTSGTSEGYDFLFRLLTHPGEAVLTPAPSYPLLDLLLDLNDLQQSRYPLKMSDDAWHFEAADARAARRTGARAMIVIHPNNPSGHAFAGRDREELENFLFAEKLPLIVDEVFLDYAEPAVVSFAGRDRSLTFTLSGVSKVLGLPQMKLSWIVVSGPQPEQEEALRRLEIIADTFLSVNAPAQNALAGWLARATEVHARIRARLAQNRRTLEEAFRDHPGARLLPGPGVWTAVLKLLRDTEDDETVAHRLLEMDHLLVQPGYFYDFSGGQHLVVSLLPEPDRFTEAVRVLAASLN